MPNDVLLGGRLNRELVRSFLPGETVKVMKVRLLVIGGVNAIIDAILFGVSALCNPLLRTPFL